MNKIIFTIIGVVAISSSYAQSPPATLTLTGSDGFDNIYTYVSSYSNGPDQEIRHTYTAGSVAGQYYYSPVKEYVMSVMEPTTGPMYLYGMNKFQVMGDPNESTYLAAGKNLDSSGMITYNFYRDENGSPLGGVVDPPIATLNYSSVFEGGGFGPGYSLGDDTDESEGAGGAVFVEQAEQLNIGLEFNDGQWTVKQ